MTRGALDWGIGSNYGLLTHFEFCCYDYNEELLCFYQNEVMLYPENPTNCSISNVEEMSIYSHLKLYPNPTSESCTIEFPGHGSIALINVEGKLIISISDVMGQAELDLKSLLPRIYFVRVVTEEGWAVRKIIRE